MGFEWNKVAYFNGMDACGIGKLERATHLRQYPAGAVIFAEVEPCAGLHLLLDGLVRLYRVNPEGRLHTLSLLRPVAAFNEVAAVDGGANPFHATAVTHVAVGVIRHDDLLAIMATEPMLMSNTVQALARLNRDYIERLEDMTFRTIPSRLAKLFLHEHAYADQFSEAPSQLTQEEIAAILGTTREVVGRAMRQLMNAGLIRKKGRSLYITDRPGLEALAESNTLPERTQELG
jgi:CRP/FNR family transcriptional regulator